MHPVSHLNLGFVECLRTADVLAACTTRLADRCAVFPTEFKFEFSETGQYASHHAPAGVGCVDALPYHDFSIT
jgi:hypothetical protein